MLKNYIIDPLNFQLKIDVNEFMSMSLFFTRRFIENMVFQPHGQQRIDEKTNIR